MHVCCWVVVNNVQRYETLQHGLQPIPNVSKCLDFIRFSNSTLSRFGLIFVIILLVTIQSSSRGFSPKQHGVLYSWGEASSSRIPAEVDCSADTGIHTQAGSKQHFWLGVNNGNRARYENQRPLVPLGLHSGQSADSCIQSDGQRYTHTDGRVNHAGLTASQLVRSR